MVRFKVYIAVACIIQKFAKLSFDIEISPCNLVNIFIIS